MTESDRVSRMSRDEFIALQNERLPRAVAYAYERVPFYRQAFDDIGLTPGDIRSLDDLHRIPFTYKSDIQAAFPYGLCAVEPNQIARVHSSSGSTGNPISTCYTAKDMDDWAVCMARNLEVAGVTPDDVCQIAFRYTLFTGAFGHHLGAERLGATVIPTSSGLTERQIQVMQAFNTTVLHCTPSYALVIAEKAEEMGLGPDDIPLRIGLHGAEPTSAGLRDELQARLGYRVARDYGLTELGGPGVSVECEAQDGYHINEDYFYPEIVDPTSGEPLPEGEIGEIVFTTLVKEGNPVLRYRTRDLAGLTRETCSCGRTLARHGLILGRTDDMLIYGGVNFFPSQVEAVLTGFAELAPHYLIRLSGDGRRESVHVHVEPQHDWWVSCSDGGAGLCELVQGRLRDQVGFRMKVEIAEPFSLERSEGKTKRVFDER
ncbi:MAG: phenylacetate--CoA ligase [Actinobacteria bacterium]|nr:phenylacetate--CoA ligase [Actinomycetota bacterium]